MEKNKLKSCLKYCGGKTKLLPYISEHIPLVEFKNYFEPFVGGGSVVLDIYSKKLSIENYNISDINYNLINCYKVIKERLQELLEELGNEKYKNQSSSFSIHRDRFNEIKFNVPYDLEVEQAALFIYLNKCCFNGMYRVNKSDKFNVPFGKMKNPLICDIITLTNLSNALQHINILHCNFKDTLNTIKEGDFVYLDPPYHKTFTDYTSNSFGENEQKELKIFIDKLTEKGVYVLLSNSATDFIKNLYSNYTIINISTKYSLGGKGSNRALDKQEVLIKNYI